MRRWGLSTICVVLLGFYAGIALAQSDAETIVDLVAIKAPPRTIQDILTALDASKPDPAQAALAKQIADSAVPEQQDAAALNAFYVHRALAALTLGRISQSIEDFQQATDNFPHTDKRFQIEDLHYLSNAQKVGGSPLSALRSAQAARNLIDSNMKGKYLGNDKMLVDLHTSLGNFDEAKKYLDDMESNFSTLRTSRGAIENGENWEAQIQDVRAQYFASQGKWVEAERALRGSLRLTDKKIKANKEKSGGSELYGQRSSRKESVIVFLQRHVREHSMLSDALLHQRKLIDAEFYARESLKLALEAFGRSSVQVASGLNALARIISEEGRHREAALLCIAAVNVLKESGVGPESVRFAISRAALGEAQASDGKYADAVKTFDEMRAGIALDPTLAAHFPTGNPDWMLALLKTGRVAEAGAMASSLLKTSETRLGPDHPETALLRAFYAMSEQAGGRLDEAKKAYARAIPILVDQARSDAENQTTSIKQQQRQNLVFEDYMNLLAKIALGNPAQAAEASGEAFQIADLVRGSGVQKALAASSARAIIKDPQLAALARQEQDDHRRIQTLSELLTGLLSTPPDQQLPAVQTKIRADIEQLKTEREKLRKEIARKFPTYADLVEPKPVSIAKVRQLLRPDEALVTWHFGDKASYVWAIRQADAPLFAQLEINRTQLAAIVASLRQSLDPGVASIEEIPAFDVVQAYGLYRKLFGPVDAAFAGKQRLLVVPHHELGQLPVALLPTRLVAQPPKTGPLFSSYKTVPWLIRDIAVVQLPSVTALTALRNMPPAPANRKNFIGFGDPFFSADPVHAGGAAPAALQLATRGTPLRLRSAPKMNGVSSAELAMLPRLPDTRLELEAVGKVLAADLGRDIYLNQFASVDKVMTSDLSDRKVIMFATHGLVPGELDGLTQPALAMSAPAVTGETQGDGLLRMDQILSLKLNADWVVLSACNTAAGEGAGAEAVSGLGRAFFYAGAKSLLVSNWSVDTVAARKLMTDLFRLQEERAGTGRGEALQQAELEMIDNGVSKNDKGVVEYAYAHPLFWAPFVVVGD